MAQALLADPTLRSMRAEQLAKALHVSTPDARAGIAAVIGLINRTAMGEPDAPLQPEKSLGLAVGPYMSLDQAMSRFGSHMGPIVTGPRPHSAIWQPDFSPDREVGAGRTGAPRGRGHGGGPGRNSPMDYGEAGLPADATEQAAAVAMADALHAHGYKRSDMGVYKEFQHSVGLNPDGFPGTKTMQELKDVLFSLGDEFPNVPIYPWLSSGGYDGVNAPLWSEWAPGAAPPGGGGGTYVAPPTTVLGTQGTRTPVAQASMGGSMFDSPWTWAILLAGGAAVAISQSKHPPRWARKIGLHR